MSSAEPLLARMTTDVWANGNVRWFPAASVSAKTCLPSTAASTYTRAVVRNSTNIPSTTGVGEGDGSGVGTAVALGEGSAIGNGVGRRAPGGVGVPRRTERSVLSPWFRVCWTSWYQFQAKPSRAMKTILLNP